MALALGRPPPFLLHEVCKVERVLCTNSELRMHVLISKAVSGAFTPNHMGSRTEESEGGALDAPLRQPGSPHLPPLLLLKQGPPLCGPGCPAETQTLLSPPE